jgi:hypothetical protein
MNFDHSSKDKDFRCDATWSVVAHQRHRSRRKSGRDRGESGSRMDNRPGPLLTDVVEKVGSSVGIMLF